MKSFRLRRTWRILPLLDEMKKCDLNKIAPEDMATHYTLAVQCPPDVLKKGIVTCIPKKQGTLHPGDFRPIIGRLFHSVLSRRMLTHWPLSNRQKAFMHGDGLADNIWLVKAIIKKKREQHLIRCPINRLLEQPTDSELRHSR